MPASETDAFRAFEHEQWQAAVEAYDRGWSALTRQTIPALLDALRAGAGTRLLDVACGPGYLAGEAAARGAGAVGVDFAAAMVARARALHPALDLRGGDAEDLPFPDGSFDAVGMNFGMLHLARPETAVGEAFRVLRPGGRFAFTAWATPERAVSFGVVLQAFREHGRPVDLPAGPDFFRYSDAATCEETLRRAGFRDAGTRPLDLLWRLGAPGDLFRAFHDGTARTGALLRGQESAARARIEGSVRTAIAPFTTAGGAVELPMAAMLAWGVRPRPARLSAIERA